MNSYDYLTPAGTHGDKRRWLKGTPVTVTLLGGSVLKTVTSGVPRMLGAGRWCVRVVGAPYTVALERVDPRYQIGLLENLPEGTSKSERG